MPTKAELEVENAELRTQLASAGGEYPHPECVRLCRCGVRHTCSGPGCWSNGQGDEVTTCVCPDHPDSAPPARPVNA